MGHFLVDTGSTVWDTDGMNETNESVNSYTRRGAKTPLIRVDESNPKFPLERQCCADHAGKFFETSDGAILLATKKVWVVIASKSTPTPYFYSETASGLREVELRGIHVEAVE